MKQISLLLLLFACSPAYTQTSDCSPWDFKRLMDEARQLARSGAYDQAIDKLQSAKTCQPQRETEVNREIKKVFEQVNGERKKAEAEARRIYANDLAFRSQIALKNNDRSAAFRLAAFAHHLVDPDNVAVEQALIEAQYCNEDPYRTQSLPWAIQSNTGHTQPITAMCAAPTGARLALGSSDRSVSLWDLKKGVKIGARTGLSASVKALAYSADGQTLAAACWESLTSNYIRIYRLHANSLEVMDSVDFPTGIFQSAVLSPDLLEVAVGSIYGDVSVWDMVRKTENKLPKIPSGINCLAFSPNGKRLAAGLSDQTAVVWDIPGDSIVSTLTGHTAAVNAVAFSPSGDSLVTGGGYGGNDFSVRIWRVSDGTELLRFSEHSSMVFHVSFSPDGLFVCSGSWDNTARVYSIAKTHRTMLLAGHDAQVACAAFSRSDDGPELPKMWLATGSWDHSFKLWDITNIRSIQTLSTDQAAAADVQFSSDGQRMTGTLITRPKKWVVAWDLRDGARTTNFEIIDNFAVLTHAPGRGYVAVKLGGGFFVARQQTPEQHLIDEPAQFVIGFSFSPPCKKDPAGGAWFAHRSERQLILRDVETGKVLLDAQNLPPESFESTVAFSAQRHYLATSSFEDVTVWKINSRFDTMTVGKKQGAYISCMAFSPDERYLIVGYRDNTAVQWDLRTRQKLKTFRGHLQPLTCVAVSPDNRWLATGSDDADIRLWDLKTGKLASVLKGHGRRIIDLAFAPDGKKLASSAGDGTLKIWDLDSDAILANVYRQHTVAAFSAAQLEAQGLENILDFRPGNEQALLATRETGQIAAFADAYAGRIAEANEPVRKDYERALRLYGACLERGEGVAEQKIAELRRLWRKKY